MRLRTSRRSELPGHWVLHLARSLLARSARRYRSHWGGSDNLPARQPRTARSR